jgi:hypothetical protein
MTKQPEESLREIALLAHFGGAANLSETDTLTRIRVLTVEHLEKGLSVADARNAINALNIKR